MQKTNRREARAPFFHQAVTSVNDKHPPVHTTSQQREMLQTSSHQQLKIAVLNSIFTADWPVCRSFLIAEEEFVIGAGSTQVISEHFRGKNSICWNSICSLPCPGATSHIRMHAVPLVLTSLPWKSLGSLGGFCKASFSFYILLRDPHWDLFYRWFSKFYVPVSSRVWVIKVI